MRSEEEIAATPVVGECKRRTVVGGFTCCVPGCFSNSVRDTGLSFYSIPNGKSKEKQDLRRRWLFMISRQNFDNPGIDLFGVTSQGTLPVATTLNLMKTNAFLVRRQRDSHILYS